MLIKKECQYLSRMSITVPFPIEYTNTALLIKELNLQQVSADPTKYLVWQIPTSVDILNNFVNQANERATVTFGDQRTNTLFFALIRQYATKRAALIMIGEMTINWVISGLPVTVGNISIARLQAMQGASVEVKARLKLELQEIYIKLSDISVTQNYQSPSPYVDTGGSIYFS